MMKVSPRFDHPLAYEKKDDQLKAATEVLLTFRTRSQVKVYDVDVDRIFFTELCSTKNGKRWVAQTAYFKRDVNLIEIEFTSFGWEP